MRRSELDGARRAGVRALTLRGRHFVLLDVACAIGSFLLAMALRFDAPSPLFDAYLRTYVWAVPVLVLARVGAFLWLRLYQRVWRYASIDELIAVLAAVVGSSTAGYLVVYAGYLTLDSPAVGFPRSVPIIDTILMIAFAGAWRFAFRVFGVERLGARTVAGLDRALVVGAGTAAISVIRDLRANTDLGLLPVGVLADDLPREQRLLGLPVFGRAADLAVVIKAQHISAVLLALPSADGRTLRRLVHEAESAGARCLTVPGVAEVLAGRTQMDALREIDVEDLLRRAPARIDQQSVADSFRGRKVLITGAGGSIGSELARQLIGFGPAQLILLGRGENSIFEAMQTLDGAASITPVILDIRDSDRLHALFREIRPDVVFHAAAHKHVTFMELYPEEAVATNVLGTQNVIHAAAEVGVERFVLISSDKAVNPTSVMGVTKRVSELLVLDAARRTGKRFATVRFGNVLSSRGSVVPIFKRQLERGQPLTVTDPEAERYFMTIPEAVQLVMQASVLAEPGDLFVLDMGDPVKIVQLATDLIELHGLKRGEDVEITFTGLRPGEKLTEELLFPYERSEATTHEAVRRIVHGMEPPASLDAVTVELRRLVDLRRRTAILEQMRQIVPEYIPAEVRR